MGVAVAVAVHAAVRPVDGEPDPALTAPTSRTDCAPNMDTSRLYKFDVPVPDLSTSREKYLEPKSKTKLGKHNVININLYRKIVTYMI